MKKSISISKDNFEKKALKITGFSFYLLTVGLIFGAVVNVINEVKPVTTIPGLVISILSILTMYFLMSAKLKVGKKLNSDAIIADANCTKTCLQLSVILLLSSLLYQFFQILYIDAIGSMAIAWLSFMEGKESFEKAARSDFKCCDND